MPNETTRYFLATTADDHYWEKESRLLFLGEWCKPNSNKEKWAMLDYTVADFYWNHERRSVALAKCDEYIDFFSEELSGILNSYHKTSLPASFWRKLLLVPLMQIIHILYDRYITILTASKKYNIDNTLIMPEKYFYTPASGWEFATLSGISDRFNLQLYSMVIQYLNLPYTLKKPDHTPSYVTQLDEKGKHIKKKIKSFIYMLLKSINKWHAQRTILFVQPYIKHKTLKSYLTFFVRSNLEIIFDDLDWINVNHTPVNLAKRKEFFSDISTNRQEPFEKALCNMFPYIFPSSILEDFHEYLRVARRFLKNSRLDAVFSRNAIHHNMLYNFLVALRELEGGYKIFYMQHGGGFGLDAPNSGIAVEKTERELADQYFTYGWSEYGAKPLYEQKIIRLSKKKTIKKGKPYIYHIMCGMPRYLYRIQFSEDSSFYVKYLNNVQNYFLHLISSIKKEYLLLRPPPKGYGWGVKEQIKGWGITNLHEGKDFYKKFSRARLIVCDHLHTTWLEALGNNLPLVAFYDPEIYSFRKTARPYIKLLEEAGILYRSPIEAARHVNSIFHHVEDWWYSAKVQEVREEFANRYARTSSNWIEEWIKAFNHAFEE